MRTAGSIDAFLREHEPLNRVTVHDVRFDDLFDIVSGDSSIPNRIRIDDHSGPVLALIEATGHIGTHPLFESSQRELLLEEELQAGLARRIAAAARMSGFPLIAADEKVLLELGHGTQFTGFGQRTGQPEGPTEQTWTC